MRKGNLNFLSTFRGTIIKIMVRTKEEFYMKAALAEAYKAYEKQEIPVGAVVVAMI